MSMSACITALVVAKFIVVIVTEPGSDNHS